VPLVHWTAPLYLLFVALLACPGPIKPLPTGAIPCASDNDCPDDYYCGFAGVDEPPSCIYSPAPEPQKRRVDGGK
jgi:hypothetical protein